MTTASDFMIGSPKTSRPALRSEVPVSTTSAMTSATPSSMAVSTAPSRWTTEASTPLSARYLATMPSYEVATVLPARSCEVCRRAGLAGEAEGGAGEAEREDLLRVGAGVDQQVAAGDADVELAGGDVDRDVAGAEVEELDLVLRVDDPQLLGLPALLVAGLMQHLPRGA
jgi:hypothetical protein